MSGAVEMVLKMTLGLFVKKARSALGNKLKDGGLNSQQLRGLIISKLDEVKTELVGLARGNLLSSASFIREGLGFLDDVFDKPDSPTPPHQVEPITLTRLYLVVVVHVLMWIQLRSLRKQSMK